MNVIARREDGAMLKVADGASGANPPAEIVLDGGRWRTTVQAALARGMWTSATERDSRKHLPGQHDQEHHGGDGVDVAPDVDVFATAKVRGTDLHAASFIDTDGLFGPEGSRYTGLVEDDTEWEDTNSFRNRAVLIPHADTAAFVGAMREAFASADSNGTRIGDGHVRAAAFSVGGVDAAVFIDADHEFDGDDEAPAQTWMAIVPHGVTADLTSYEALEDSRNARGHHIAYVRVFDEHLQAVAQTLSRLSGAQPGKHMTSGHHMTATSTSRKHLPGQHDQDSHAGSRGWALPGLQALSSDQYQSMYGDTVDEHNTALDDGTYLTVRYFDSGEAHTVLDLPGDRHQVLEEMTPQSMRALADDLESVADPDDVYEAGDDDIIADADSAEHDSYVARYSTGDIRFQPNATSNDDYLDLSDEQAGELADGLRAMADGHEDDLQSADGKSTPSRHDTTRSTMRTKAFQPTFKSASKGSATFRIAQFNVIDKDGDVTLPGFFGEQHAQMVPVHDWNHVPIGKARIYEDPDGGLADVKFNLAIPEAKNWYEAILFDMDNPPSLQEYSYGFEILDGGSKRGNFGGKQVRILQPRSDGSPGVRVFEVSPVLQGAGVGTHTVGVKSRTTTRGGAVPSTATPAVKGAIPAAETGTVSRAWDAATNVAALPDDARPSQLRTVYAWVDPDGDPECKSSYQFPHHHGIDGPANLRACVIGIAALNGTSGAAYGEPERKGIYDHLAAHLRDADREPPQLRTADGMNRFTQQKNLRFGDQAADVLAAVSALADRASDVMALRQRKGKGMAAGTADLLNWVGDELVRLKSLLSHPIEDDTPQPTEDEINSVLLAAVAAVNNI